jgi:tetratricopeptide (TPR) repeat protein
MGNSLFNLGSLYYAQGKFKEAKKLFQESLEIRRQLGNKKGICMSLTYIARLNFNQGKTKEAEGLYKECLDIRRELGDKGGISAALNNLGFLNFENGKTANSKEFYLEAIKLKTELNNISGIIGSIHRAFSLFEDSERDNYYGIAKSLLNESSKPNQLSQLANIELMQYCLSTKKVNKTLIQEKINYVKTQNEKSTLKDIDDLPVEAFYLATIKLTEIGEPKKAKMVADDALKMIGEKKSIRKETFQKIAKQVAPKID